MLAPGVEPRAAEVMSQTPSLEESTAVLTRKAQTQWEEIITICSLAKSSFVDNDFSPNAKSQFGGEGKAKGCAFLTEVHSKHIINEEVYIASTQCLIHAALTAWHKQRPHTARTQQQSHSTHMEHS
jgi:hypothetical protein